MFRDKMGRPLTTQEVSVKIVNRISNILLDFGLFVLYCTGQVPSHLFRLFMYRLAGMKIGKGSRIHMWARFYYPMGITIGEDTIIGDNAFLDGRYPLTIGNHVDIASRVLIYNSAHDVHSEDFGSKGGPIIIGDYVFIGPRVTILPDVTIGRGAVVAAGAVVTSDVPEFAIFAGVPARQIGERENKDPHYKLGRARLFQ